ncbi:hypothetical protein AVEN_25030-1 [Araneus ventricosus]|uniref:Uncharacterized protein n=1 Tax=Araneus ventricosus TaxID=182803 RepID=A0A4Y2KZS1_ARAVE|nr:hypothetical protein AVEN_25030-1 [Araneus ventricosus]
MQNLRWEDVANFPTKVREVSPLNPVRAWPDGGGPSFNLSCKLAACCERESSISDAPTVRCHTFFRTHSCGARELMCTRLNAKERHIIVT